MSNLTKVQKASKVFYVLSRIAFIFCIVMCASSALSIPLCVIYGDNPELLNYFMELGLEYSKNQLVCECVSSMIETGAMIAVYCYACRFFKKELEIGTPFDKRVAKSMKILGMLHIFIPCGVIFINTIVSICFGVEDSIMMTDSSIVLGIVYMVFSLVLAHGADVTSLAKQNLLQNSEKGEKQSQTESTEANHAE